MRPMFCRNNARSRGWLVLAAVTLVMTLIWGLLLPRVAATESFRKKRESLKQHGIDPAAVFYTDHPEW